MPLLALWSSNPTAISLFTIEQVVATAGSGELRDNSDCSEELREYLSQTTTVKLAEYVERCLVAHFPKSGMVLQDLVNELGRRLDYAVTNGRYQGTVNSIGYDGIWVSPEGETIITEVKTTDAYRISLGTIAGYRERLLEKGQIGTRATILIVVGREDTGELEAQVRGSRHAWDMRLISVDSLVKLVQLKENAEGPETGRKIRSLLVPREYTRLDDMIDVMFTTAKDVETAAVLSASEEERPDEAAGPSVREKGRWEFTDSRVLEDKRLEIVAALATREGTTLIKVSPALYRSPDQGRRAAFTLSKKYQRKNLLYWYAYHPRWDEFLGDRENSYLVLGCIDRSEAFAIPTNKLHSLLNDLYTTTNTEGVYYWHIQLTENNEGDTALILPKRNATFSLAEFTLKL